MSERIQPDLEVASCPMCASAPGVDPRHDFPPFRVAACRNCGLLFLSPRLSEAAILRLYQDEDYYASSVAGQGYDEYMEAGHNWVKTFRRRLMQIRRYQAAGRALDIGCGPGYFLEAAESLGYEAWGLDPSEYIVSIARQRFGQRVRLGTIHSANFEPGSFDLIVAFDTFEHIYDPLDWLAAVHDLLRPRGVLAITTPDASSLLARISGRKWVSFKIPEHVFFWSPRTIRRALAERYEVLEISRAGQYATAGFLLRRLLRLPAELRGPLKAALGALNRLSLYADNGSMTVIARRR